MTPVNEEIEPAVPAISQGAAPQGYESPSPDMPMTPLNEETELGVSESRPDRCLRCPTPDLH